MSRNEHSIQRRRLADGVTAFMVVARTSLAFSVALIAGVIAGFTGTFVIQFVMYVADWGTPVEWIYFFVLTLLIALFGGTGVLLAREIGRILTNYSIVVWSGVALGIIPGFFLWLWLAFATND